MSRHHCRAALIAAAGMFIHVLFGSFAAPSAVGLRSVIRQLGVHQNVCQMRPVLVLVAGAFGTDVLGVVVVSVLVLVVGAFGTEVLGVVVAPVLVLVVAALGAEVVGRKLRARLMYTELTPATK